MLLVPCSGCLEPSGEKGYLTAEAIAEKEQIAAEEAAEVAAAKINFEDLQPVFQATCATEQCHTRAGGITPSLEFQSSFFAALNPIIDPNDLVGPRVLEIIQGNTDVIMPPEGEQLLDTNPDFVTQYQTWVEQNFDASGARVLTEDAE